MKSGLLCAARASSAFAPTDVAAFSNCLLMSLETPGRLLSSLHNLMMRNANSKVPSLISCGVLDMGVLLTFSFFLFTFSFDYPRQRIRHPRLRPAHVLNSI